MNVQTACMVSKCVDIVTQMCQEMTIVLLLLYALPAAFRKRGRDNEISLRELAS